MGRASFLYVAKSPWQQLVDLPPHKVGEIVGGELIVSPRPGGPHSLAAGSVHLQIGPPFHRGLGGPGGWWILFEPELHLGPDVLVPDLAAWRRERLPAPSTAFFTTPPDWICEVVSPGTAALDRARKLPIYAACGIPHAWVIDPTGRTVEALELGGAAWVIHTAAGGNQVVRLPPFESVDLDLASLWLPP